MKNLLLIVFAFSGIVAIPACSPANKASNTSGNSNDLLYEKKWYVSELNGRPFTFTGPDNTYAWIQITDGNPVIVSGRTGCNNLTGSVFLTAMNGLKFSPLATTRMACPGGFEAELLSALSKVTKYTIKDSSQLVLIQDTAALIRLNGISPETDKLSGTWELNDISGPKITFEGLYPEKKPFISFNFAEHAIMGNTSCNGFSAPYTMKGNKIEFGDGLKTMIFCEGGGEETFLSMLKKVNHYSLIDNTLTFFTNEVAVMRFSKK